LIQEDILLEKLKTHVNSLLKKDMYKNNHIECCPICDSIKYIKYGSYKGIQRYRCKECERTFSNATNSMWSYSKKNLTQWIEFIELMMEKKSLRFCADKLNINLATAFYWRHKILHGLTLDSMPNELKGDVYIGKTLIQENFKGCRNITTTKRLNIWVIGAKGTEDSMLIKPISRGFWDLERFKENIYHKIAKGSYIIPYGDRYISLVAKSHNKKSLKQTKDEDRIKYFGNSLNGWLSSFHGIATKYLEEYIPLFILFKLDRVIDYMDMIHYLSHGNRFIRIKEIGLV